MSHISAPCGHTQPSHLTQIYLFIYLFCARFLSLGCVRRWCPWRTRSSQRPPPRCRNGGSCGSSFMWLVAAAPKELGQYKKNKLRPVLFSSASSSGGGGMLTLKESFFYLLCKQEWRISGDTAQIHQDSSFRWFPSACCSDCHLKFSYNISV